jgi:hypothetical protein
MRDFLIKLILNLLGMSVFAFLGVLLAWRF